MATGTCVLTFEHFSPYVICGDPVDDVNPMSGLATDGFVIEAVADPGLQIEVSGDQGQEPQPVSAAAGGKCDATEIVKGQ